MNDNNNNSNNNSNKNVMQTIMPVSGKCICESQRNSRNRVQCAYGKGTFVDVCVCVSVYSSAIIRIRKSYSLLFCYSDELCFSMFSTFRFSFHCFRFHGVSTSFPFARSMMRSFFFSCSFSLICSFLFIPFARSTFFVRCNSFYFLFFILSTYFSFLRQLNCLFFFRFNFVVSHNLFFFFSFIGCCSVYFSFKCSAFLQKCARALAATGFSVHVKCKSIRDCFKFGAMR